MTGTSGADGALRMAVRATLAAFLLAASSFQGSLRAQDRPDVQEEESQTSSVEVTTAEPQQSGGDVLEVAAQMQRYSTFLNLVEEAGLEDDIQAGGPFTIFMPTDQALAALPPERLKALRADGDELRRFIRTHIAMGEWTAEELSGASQIENLLGAELPLETEMELEAPRSPAGQDQDEAGEKPRPDQELAASLRIADARVIEPDHRAENGVVHGIDSVLEAPGTLGVVGAAPQEQGEGEGSQ